MRTTGSAPDPYYMRYRGGQIGVNEPTNMDIYTQVANAIVPGEVTAAIIIYGQSNAANYVNGMYTATQAKSHMLNPFNGGMYRTRDPVVGCNGSPNGVIPAWQGSWTSRLGDKLIASGKYQRVIICNVAAGGTSSTQWAPGGDCNNRLIAACNRMTALTVPTLVIRHQGETDSSFAFSAETVTANIRAEVNTIRQCGVTAPVMVCKVAFNGAGTPFTPGYASTRAGQAAALSDDLGIYVGIDTDIYESSFRQSDDLHWSTSGAEAVATDMKNRIVSFFP